MRDVSARTVVGEVVGGALDAVAGLRRLVLAQGLVGHALSLVGDLVHDEGWGVWVVVFRRRRCWTCV